MPALNFQARFAPLVESGAKTQTIRKRRKDGRDPKPGDRLVLYTGMRTKACRKLGDGIVTSADPITISRLRPHSMPYWEVYRGEEQGYWGADRCERPQDADRRFARRDGFRSWSEMYAWFEATHGLPFEGLLIRWRRVK